MWQRFHLTIPVPAVWLGLGFQVKITHVEYSRAIFERAFRIPPDFDDSFVNVGLGALLLDLGGEFPDAVALWVGQNPNVMSLVDALRQYAYRPFSGDQNVNTIDPRTFYYMRHFLGEAEARKEDIALVPTWVSIACDKGIYAKQVVFIKVKKTTTAKHMSQTFMLWTLLVNMD